MALHGSCGVYGHVALLNKTSLPNYIHIIQCGIPGHIAIQGFCVRRIPPNSSLNRIRPLFSTNAIPSVYCFWMWLWEIRKELICFAIMHLALFKSKASHWITPFRVITKLSDCFLSDIFAPSHDKTEITVLVCRSIFGSGIAVQSLFRKARKLIHRFGKWKRL